LLVLAGCAHKSDVVGKWKIDAGSVPTGKNDPAAAMAKSMSSMLSIEFKADNTFSGMMMEGTYAVSGNTVTMTATKMMGMDLSKFPGAKKSTPQTAQLSSDGKTLTIHAPSATSGPQDVKFIKDTSQ
jgi:hypothetical protein